MFDEKEEEGAEEEKRESSPGKSFTTIISQSFYHISVHFV